MASSPQVSGGHTGTVGIPRQGAEVSKTTRRSAISPIRGQHGVAVVPSQPCARSHQPVHQIDVRSHREGTKATHRAVHVGADAEIRACTWPVPLAPRLGAIEPIVETLGRHRMLSPVHRPRSHDGIKGPCVGSDQVGQPRPRHHTVSVGGSQPDRRVSDRSGREPRCPSSSRVAAGNQQHSDPFTDDSLGAIGTGIQRYQRRQRQLHRIRGRSNAGQTCRQPVGLRRALE